MARANPNTIVVLTTGAAVEMPWLDRVQGVFEAWYPGQEQGRAVAALLFGDERFSGKPPLAWPRSERQVNARLGIENPYDDVNNPGVAVPHDEGIFVGYRGYDRAGADPLFPFGFGLTYGDVRYRDVQVRDPRLGNANGNGARDNTGRSPVTEIVQVYAGRLPTAVETPRRQLLGWARVTLRPGQRRWVEVPIELDTPTHQLAYWNTARDAWVTPTGRTAIYVGRSSRDIRLTDAVEVRRR